MTGALLLDNAASASAPDLSFDGDANTGIYSPGADQVAISTNGTGRLFVNASGNVGIGTSSPLASAGFPGVTVSGPTGGIYWLAKAGAQKGYLYGQDNDVTLASTDASGVIRLLTGGNNERMRIDSSGNVGIGDSSPNTNLVVKGASNSLTNSVGNINVISTDSAAINAGGSIGLGGFYNGTSNSIPFANLHGKKENGTGNNAAGYFAISTRNASSGTAERMRIDSSGRVKAKGGFLYVQNSASGTGDTDGLALISDGNADKYVWNYDNTSLRFGTNALERMRIDSSGNVGVGTTSINNKFVIASSGSATAYFHSVNASTGTSGNDGIVMGMGDATNAYFWNYESGSIVFATNATERMRINSSGNVGIGTTSIDASLHVKGAGTHGTFVLEAGGTSGISNQIYIQGHNNAGTSLGEINFEETAANQGALVFKTNGGSVAERMRINNLGDVGVGTTAPTYYGGNFRTLEVAGSAGNDGGIFSTVTADNAVKAYFYTDSTSDTATIGTVTNHPLLFRTNTVERMRIDSSGNMGLGISNPAAGASGGSNRILNIASGTSSGVSHITFGDTNAVGKIESVNGNGTIAINATTAVTIGTSGSSTERMRITSDGKFGFNTSNPGAFDSGANNFVVLGNTSGTGNAGITIVSGSNNNGNIYFGDGTGSASYRGFIVYNHTSDAFQIGTAGSERMRITNQGATWAAVNTSVNLFGSTIHYHGWRQGSGNQWVGSFVNEGSSGGYGVIVQHQNTTQDTSHWFFNCNNNNGNKVIFYSNGGLANFQSNNANLCDEREKKNIETLDSTWSCLKNWELKKFHYNEDADTDNKRYGIIAQQIAEYCPEVITDWTKRNAKDAVLDDDGNVVTPAVEEITRMGVKEQQMMWLAIKALQEAQARIETLEQRLSDAGIA
jgi:hypothetical protein